ncbi:hypothetical protein Q9966_003860 [Columba livia]|nr:hypothetical protein Q9966_003860 [Columba livia]
MLTWISGLEGAAGKCVRFLNLADFLNQIIGKPSSYFWIGLSRPSDGKGWTWLNGSLVDWRRFDVRGKGQCAYINQDGVSSDWCSQTKFSVCSHRQNRPSAIQKDS